MHIHTDTDNTPINMPVDTLAIAQELQAAGISKKHAEAQAKVFGQIINQNLADKQDVALVRRDIEVIHRDIEVIHRDIAVINRDIAVLRGDVENSRKESKVDSENLRKDLLLEIAKIKIEILKWVIPMMVGQLIAATGLMKIFIN